MTDPINKLDTRIDFGVKFLETYFSSRINYHKWFSLVGFVYLSWQTFKGLRFLYQNILRPRRDLLIRYGEGSWVIVVGASGGLGKAFCEAFADAGFNIILVGRNRAKLELTAKFVRSRNMKTDTVIIVTDLRAAINGPDFVDHIIFECGDLDVAMLVNCTCVADNEFFHNREDNSLMEELAVNVIAPTLITKKIIPKFLLRSNKSAIINVSSGYGARGTPYTVPYSPSMAYLDVLTRSVGMEVRDKIDVISVVPYELKTNYMFNQRYTSDSILPYDCARSVLDSLGYENRTAGHWKHKMIESALDSIPETLLAELYERTGPRYMEWRKVNASKTANKI